MPARPKRRNTATSIPPSALLEKASEAARKAEDMKRDIRYRIQGRYPLRGTIDVSGSKNASLPLLAASILVKGETVFTNVPRLRDIETMFLILRYLGAEVSATGTTVRIRTDELQNKSIPHDLVSKLRGSIVLLGPLLARFGEVEMAYPGGCVLGKRPVDAHTAAFMQMGAEDLSTESFLKLKGKLKPSEVVLPEFSVTATENVLLAAALVPGQTRIELAAAEPHVQDVCAFLSARDVAVEGIGSHTLIVEGGKSLLPSGEHTVTSDYLEAGALLLAGILSKGSVTLRGADKKHLTSFLGALRRVGAKIEMGADGSITADGSWTDLKATRVQTNIFPGFPTDLQAPFGVLLSQAQGVSRIFEVLFDGRMAYLYELEKMGGHIEILNSHQALIIGKTPLIGRQVQSNDIRAGAAMVLAGLCAEGETVVTDIQYIERGYDRLEEKLTSLGAHIIREAE